jgi:predicted phosphodiesterase
MALAALYDVHGNLPALEAVLKEVRSAGVDRILVGGDVVPGPMPTESLDLLLGVGIPVHCIHGNGEIAVLAEIDRTDVGVAPEPFRPVVRWVAGELHDSDVEMIRGWPATLATELPGLGRVLFCHATPKSAHETFTRETPDQELRRRFAGVDFPLVVCGHTHMQFDRTVGRTRIVNAGSVGMPFGEPGAYWLLLDGEVRFRRTEYDLEAAAKAIRATAYPDADGFAERSVLSPPSEADMLRAFTRSGMD